MAWLFSVLAVTWGGAGIGGCIGRGIAGGRGDEEVEVIIFEKDAGILF